MLRGTRLLELAGAGAHHTVGSIPDRAWVLRPLVGGEAAVAPSSATLLDVTTLQPGDVIGGRYRLLRVIGAGAMGVVWSARNESTERDFAVKLMMPEAAKDPQRLSRFFKEAKLAGRLRHRCIVEVYDLGKIEDGPHQGAPYLVMELLDGEPLDGLLRRIGKFPAGTALRIVADVARGLAVAHAQGIVHRDLKPANVFLHRTLEGFTVPKILDFGISKLLPGALARESFNPQETTIGTILGSPAYMSPEQTSGEDLDARADIWSLGVVLYKALSGALPFFGGSFTNLMLAINTTDPKPLEERIPGLPQEVYALVNRCLSRRRSERFPTAAALADAIDAVLDEHELPVLELSQVVGEIVPIPSEHMKTLELHELRGGPGSGSSASMRSSATRPLSSTGDDMPLDETRAVSSDIITRDARDGVDGTVRTSVLELGPGIEASRPLESPRRRRGLVALVASGFALAALAAVAARPRPSPAPAVTAAAPRVEMTTAPMPIVVEPPAPRAEAATSTMPSTKPKVSSPKHAPPKPKNSAAPHEGLVRPGF